MRHINFLVSKEQKTTNRAKRLFFRRILAVFTFVLKIFLIVSVVSAQSGVLIPQPGDKPAPKVLSIAVMNVDVLIDNQHATVKVMQIFDNHTANALEGKYIFGLSQTSSISDFAVWDNDMRIPGVMMEKRRANQIYGQIKQKRTDPGILQSTDSPGAEDSSSGSGFSAKIFPINPFGTKRLEMEYTEELPVENLTSHFMFPLKPSYGEMQSVGEFNLTMHLISDFPVTPLNVEQSPYPLQTTALEPNEYTGEFHAKNIELNDDFAFDYQIGPCDNALSVITHRAPEKISAYDLRDPSLAKPNPDGYFQAQAVFASKQNEPKPPRRVIVLLDTSLSMYGDKLSRAVEAVDFFLHDLAPADEFNVLLFNEGVATFAPKPVAASSDSVEQAMQFIKTSALGGGTDLKQALEKSVEQSRLFTDGEPSVVLISDGNPTLQTVDTKTISSAFENSNARLFAFALGADANGQLLKNLSEKKHGFFDRVKETEDIGLKLRLFFDKVGTPDISSLKLGSSDLKNLYDVYASGDNSYPGSSFSFVGRYRKPQTQTITFAGRYGQENFAFSRDVALPELEVAHAHLPRVWARARVDALLQAMNRDGEREDFIAEIIRLSEEYKFVTPYTALLAAPRALLRPRLIQPGDPVIRVKTDPSVTAVFAVLPFGQTIPLRFSQTNGLWETRFLAPSWMADGTYTCRLLLTDKDGNGYQEQKSFIIDSRAPKIKINLDKQISQAGEDLLIKVLADSDTTGLTARVYGAKPVQLRWNNTQKANVGRLHIPETLSPGRYNVTVTAEDFAHNQTTEETTVEIVGR